MADHISEEALEKRLGSAMETVNVRIFQEKLRPLQVPTLGIFNLCYNIIISSLHLQTLMLRCSLTCSEDTVRFPGHQQMHECQQRCVSSFGNAEAVVESELKQLQVSHLTVRSDDVSDRASDFAIALLP